MGKSQVPGFASIYRFCHVPLDRIVIAHLQPFFPPSLSSPWSRVDDYEAYTACHQWIRTGFALVPLDVACIAWAGKSVQAFLIRNHELSRTADADDLNHRFIPSGMSLR